MAAYGDAKTALLEAFIELSETLPVDKITVKNITERCGLSVRTFYNYFEDKYDLMAYAYTRRFDEVFNDVYLKGAPFEVFMRGCIGKHMEQRPYDLNANKHTHGLDSMRTFIRRYNTEVFEGYLEERFEGRLDDEIRFDLLFFLRAAADAIIDWSLAGMTQDPDELARWIRRAMPPLLVPYLDPSNSDRV